jgi:hypothetical protein|tara:strand:+ start:2613 stop:2957 length:345 start_codon:yes stop_codon:yes gene_type:complete
MSTKEKIKTKCKEIQELLITKNIKYGDSALEPCGVFSKCDASTGLRVRIDDKLKRIQNIGELGADEDTLLDLTGYLILLMIAKENEGNSIQKRLRKGGATSHTTNNSASPNTNR